MINGSFCRLFFSFSFSSINIVLTDSLPQPARSRESLGRGLLAESLSPVTGGSQASPLHNVKSGARVRMVATIGTTAMAGVNCSPPRK